MILESRRRFILFVLFVLLSLALPGSGLLAASWPEIPEAERQLSAFPGVPNAPAVVLLNRGELYFDDRAVSSYFEVYTRIKILNEEGRKYATIEIPASKFSRVRNIEGRTLQPNGSVVELDKDARFEKKFSTFYRFSVHSIALPAVEVGSIVEFKYRQFFDTVIFTEPWYFESELPTLRSEIECTYPLSFGFAPVKFSPYGREIKEKVERTPTSHRSVYWMENLPPIADEPARLPFADLSSWALFIPQEFVSGGRVESLLRDWEDAVEIVQGFGNSGYKAARGKAGSTKSEAKKLAASAPTPRAKAEAVYRFVRDQITTARWSGVGVGERTCDKTLKEAQGTYADKAVLLQTMLKAVKVDSSLGWVRPKDAGRTQVNLPTPFQFDRVLVVAQLDGERVFLDPSEPDLPFGNLPPDVEGIPCLLVDTKKPEWVDTPVSPAQSNRRVASLDLEVSGEGVLSGGGQLVFEGHSAWTARKDARSSEDPAKYWETWLEGRFPSYEFEDVKVQSPDEERRLVVSWKQSQRPDEALGDEVSIKPGAPLALTSNPFSLPPGRRLTPVQLTYADIDEVQLTLTWPEDWELEDRPQVDPFQNGAGLFEAKVEVDAGQRRLRLHRNLTLGVDRFVGTDAYTALHELYTRAAAGDAEQIVLVRQ